MAKSKYVPKTAITIGEVPEGWREIERVRRRLGLTMPIYAAMLSLCFQSYHDRISGRKEGRYVRAFQALAEKIERIYVEKRKLYGSKKRAVTYLKRAFGVVD